MISDSAADEAENVGVARRRQNRINFKRRAVKALDDAKKLDELTTAILVVCVSNGGVRLDSSHAMRLALINACTWRANNSDIQR